MPSPDGNGYDVITPPTVIWPPPGDPGDGGNGGEHPAEGPEVIVHGQSPGDGDAHDGWHDGALPAPWTPDMDRPRFPGDHGGAVPLPGAEDPPGPAAPPPANGAPGTPPAPGADVPRPGPVGSPLPPDHVPDFTGMSASQALTHINELLAGRPEGTRPTRADLYNDLVLDHFEHLSHADQRAVLAALDHYANALHQTNAYTRLGMAGSGLEAGRADLAMRIAADFARQSGAIPENARFMADTRLGMNVGMEMIIGGIVGRGGRSSGKPTGTPAQPPATAGGRADQAAGRRLALDLAAAQAHDPRIGTTLPGAPAPIVVTAEAHIGGRVFFDTNQTARPTHQARADRPTLIADRVEPGEPNSHMQNAHAEIGAIQQAFDAGLTQGQHMTLVVRGQAFATIVGGI